VEEEYEPLPGVVGGLVVMQVQGGAVEVDLHDPLAHREWVRGGKGGEILRGSGDAGGGILLLGHPCARGEERQEHDNKA